MGDDDNLVGNLANSSRKMPTLKNEQQVIDQAKRVAAKHK